MKIELFFYSKFYRNLYSSSKDRIYSRKIELFFTLNFIELKLIVQQAVGNA